MKIQIIKKAEKKPRTTLDVPSSSNSPWNPAGNARKRAPRTLRFWEGCADNAGNVA
jgi:hypothetical protein